MARRLAARRLTTRQALRRAAPGRARAGRQARWRPGPVRKAARQALRTAWQPPSRRRASRRRPAAPRLVRELRPRFRPQRVPAPARRSRRRSRTPATRARYGAPSTSTASGRAGAARPAAASSNGKRELSRDIKLTLKRPDFERARRFTLSFQVEDEDNRVVDSVRGLQVDLGAPGELAKVLLRLNIALQAKE